MKISIINGPNLNLLGTREPEVYGNQNFAAYFEQLQTQYPDLTLSYYQSNVEGELINELHRVGFESDGIILNAAAYTHTSVGLGDAVKAIHAPVASCSEAGPRMATQAQIGDRLRATPNHKWAALVNRLASE